MLRNLADMVVNEITKEIEPEADRPARPSPTMTLAEFFDSVQAENGLSVLLFDIDDVLPSHDHVNAGTSPGEIFTELLRDYFPTASSIVHVGDYHFCVLLKTSDNIDEVRAINHLCSDAKNLLSFADGHDSLAPFVGRINYRSNTCVSVDNLVSDADGMFVRHEPQPPSERKSVKGLLKRLLGHRNT